MNWDLNFPRDGVYDKAPISSKCCHQIIFKKHIATAFWIHACCQISFPIGKEMFYFDSSYAIRKRTIKAKTFIFLRRIPLCDTFGCYCKTEIYLFKGEFFWEKNFCHSMTPSQRLQSQHWRLNHFASENTFAGHWETVLNCMENIEKR